MTYVPTAQKLFYPLGRIRVPVRAGRMAGANGNPDRQSGMGAACGARRDCGGAFDRRADLPTLQGYALLRGEVDHENSQ